MNDIALRAGKTFIQAFLGVLIPELCVFLRQDFPFDLSSPVLIFAPMFCAALAAGLSAAWNYLAKFFTVESGDSTICGIDVECEDFED